MLTYILAAALVVLYTLGSFYPAIASRTLADQLQRQFGPFQRLEVHVDTDPPIRAVGGEVDSLKVLAEGFTIQGVPVATASVDTGEFSVNASALWFGKQPHLMHPIDGTASVSVTEDGLNTLLHSDQVIRQLKGIPTQFSLIPGFAIKRTVDILPGRLRLLNGRVSVDGNVNMEGTLIPFTVAATPRLLSDHEVALADVQASMMGAPVPPSLLGTAANRTLDLTRYQAPGTAYRLSSLDVLPGVIRLQALVTVTELTAGRR